MDPITISAVIGGAKALKSAFDFAKSAMEEFRECAEAGMSATESMGSLIKVFTAQGEVQKQINDAKKQKIEPPAVVDGQPVEPVARKSATVVALEAMQYERELKQHEEELKHYLTWQCQEPGLYAELCQRRDAIVNAEREEEEERRRAAMEIRLREKAELMRKRREKQRKIDFAVEVLTVIVGAIVSGALIYGIYFMVTYKG